MENNVSADDLRTIILPDIAAFSEEAKRLWRPEIKDAELRQAMFSDPYLSDYIYDDLLSEFGLGSTLSVNLLAEQEDLLFLLQSDVQVIALRAGLVRHGNELASLVSAGKLNFTNAEWNVDDLRFALSLRTHSGEGRVSDETFASAVNEAGQDCLSAWLGTLPDTVQRAIEISGSTLGAALRRLRVSSLDANIFSVCLKTMRELA